MSPDVQATLWGRICNDAGAGVASPTAQGTPAGTPSAGEMLKGFSPAGGGGYNPSHDGYGTHGTPAPGPRGWGAVAGSIFRLPRGFPTISTPRGPRAGVLSAGERLLNPVFSDPLLLEVGLPTSGSGGRKPRDHVMHGAPFARWFEGRGTH